MNNNFEKLPEEKQKNIIKAAVDEFGVNGFDNASTDKIAAEAGIAKGSLFYYFGSKKNLYLFIVEYCVNLLTDEILKKAESIQSQDFYERIKRIALIKQDILISYPFHSKILMDAFINMPDKIKGDLEKLYFKYYSINMKFVEEYLIQYMKVDLLKPTIKSEDAMFVTITLLDALSKKYMGIYKNKADEMMEHKEELFKEFDKYIDIIKYGLYK